MGVNITVDGLTYSGVEQMYVGGKSLALSADAGANYGPGLVERFISAISDKEVKTWQ